MPSLEDANPAQFAKIMLIGDSGTGKTGSLISLLEAGYFVHVIDMDNGLKFVANYLRANNPAFLKKIDYVHCRDKYRLIGNEMRFVPPATAYMQAAKLLDKWEDGTNPSTWGGDHVLVIDSLTYLGQAALNQAYTLKPTSQSGARPDGKMIYGMAGESMMNIMMSVMGDNFGTNVILMSHISYREFQDGTMRGLPTTIGQMSSEKAPGLFNDMFLVEKQGQGAQTKRVIRTIPSATIDAKTSALDLPKDLPLETGMATIFKAIRGK